MWTDVSVENFCPNSNLKRNESTVNNKCMQTVHKRSTSDRKMGKISFQHRMCPRPAVIFMTSRITTPYNEPKTDFYSVSCQYVEYNVPWAKPIIKAPKIDLTSTPTGTNSSTTVNGKQSCKNI